MIKNSESQDACEDDEDGDEIQGNEVDASKTEFDQSEVGTEPAKKKRGRKPKSFYENKAKMEQEAQEKLREIQQNTMNDAENEEEVLARQDEYI